MPSLLVAYTHSGCPHVVVRIHGLLLPVESVWVHFVNYDPRGEDHGTGIGYTGKCFHFGGLGRYYIPGSEYLGISHSHTRTAMLEDNDA